MADISQSNYHIHITAKHRWLHLNLKEVWRYRDLILLFTRRNFVVSYKQTVLGPAWIFLTPLFSSIVQAFVFGGIAGIETDGIPMLLFYLCSNAVWGFFSTCLTNNAGTFTENAYVFGKVYFPRLTTPISNILSCAIRFGIQMILVLIFMVYFLIQGTVHPNWWAWFLIPVELIHLGILGMGFGIIISSLTTKYRDLTVLVTFGVQLWMYASPIVYSVTQIPEQYRFLYLLNPVAPIVTIFRYAFLGTGFIPFLSWGISWGVTIVVLALGVILFCRIERTFMDTI